jgi:hypothetical protein
MGKKTAHNKLLKISEVVHQNFKQTEEFTGARVKGHLFKRFLKSCLLSFPTIYIKMIT